jgi:hypothetical protein
MWRDVGRQLRFLGFDGRSIFLLLLLMYYWSWWMLLFVVLGFFLLWLIERRGYTLSNGFRKVRTWVGGARRPATAPRRLGRSDR